MENLNYLPIAVAALIPTFVGFLYYNPKTFGSAWMASLGKTEKELQEGFNMPLVMGICLVLAFILSFMLNATVELTHKEVVEGALVYGSHHTFGHGALHGAMIAALVITPAMIINGLFERKSWTNMLIHAGYWIITFALMAGLTDAWN